MMYIVLPIPIILSFSRDVKQIRLFAFAYVVATIINGLIILKMGGFNLGSSLLFELLADGDQIGKSILNYHRIGVAFGISLILLFYFFTSSKSVFKYVIIAMSFIFLFVMLFLIGSRQMIFAILLSLPIYLFVSIKTPHTNQKLGFFLLGILILIFLNWLFENLGFLLLRGQNLDYSIVDESSSRMNFWQKGLNSFFESPIFGTLFQTRNGHNLFIGTLEAEGIVGLIFLVVYLLFVVRQIRVILRVKDASFDNYTKAFIFILFFGLVHSQFSGDFISIPHLYWPAAVLWGYSSSLRRLKKPGNNYLLLKKNVE